MSESFTMVKNSDIILAYKAYKSSTEKYLIKMKDAYVQEKMQSKKLVFGLFTKKGMSLEQAQESWSTDEYRVGLTAEEWYGIGSHYKGADQLYSLACYNPEGTSAIYLSNAWILKWIK